MENLKIQVKFNIHNVELIETNSIKIIFILNKPKFTKG